MSVLAGAAAKLAAAKLEWAPVQVTPVWMVYVTRDALRADGLRLPVSAAQAQRVADHCGCLLPTAQILDAIWLAAEHKASPTPIAPATWQTNPESASRQFNLELDRLTSHGGLVATAGKSWVLDPLVTKKPSSGVNYGWHSASAPYSALSPAAGRVWQPLASAHGLTHVDYSQTLRLVHPTSIFEGARTPTADVYARLGIPARYAVPAVPQGRDPGSPERASGPMLAALAGAGLLGFVLGLGLVRQAREDATPKRPGR